MHRSALSTPVRSISLLALPAAVLLLAGCQDWPFLYRPNQVVKVTKVHEVPIGNSDADILFVIDNSGSMREEQNNLIRNSTVFVEKLAQSENLYRIGVITTDFLDEGAPGQDGGRLRMVPASQSQLDAAGCNISPSTPAGYLVRPDPNASNLDDLHCRLVEDFRATVASLGIEGSGTEAGLAAARAALDPTAAAGTNGDFLRPDADLVLIFLTDEDDCSLTHFMEPPRPNSYCYRDAVQDLIPVADYVSYFASLKGTGGVRKVRAALIAGGTLEGEEGTDFVARGCRLQNDGTVSGGCGCWTSTDDGFFCDYLTGFGHACSDTSGCYGPPGDPGDFCMSTPTAGTCDISRCDALPGNRYSDFLTALAAARNAVGFDAGVYADTICRAEYQETLEHIVDRLLVGDCFVLSEPSLDEHSAYLVKRTFDTGDTYAEELVPQFDAVAPSSCTCLDAECNACDGTCATGAWFFPQSASQGPDLRQVCLSCGLEKRPGTEFLLTVVNEVRGLEEVP